jgi:hypothetical protein
MIDQRCSSPPLKGVNYTLVAWKLLAGHAWPSMACERHYLAIHAMRAGLLLYTACIYGVSCNT